MWWLKGKKMFGALKCPLFKSSMPPYPSLPSSGLVRLSEHFAAASCGPRDSVKHVTWRPICPHLSRWDVLRDSLQHSNFTSLQVHHTNHRDTLIGQTLAPVFTVHTPVLLKNGDTHPDKHNNEMSNTPCYTTAMWRLVHHTVSHLLWSVLREESDLEHVRWINLPIIS